MTRRLRRALVFGVLACALVVTTRAEAQTSGPASPADAPSAASSLDLFSGRWTYNKVESVNAATGRPEESPRSATTRTPGRGGGRGAGAVPPAALPQRPPSDGTSGSSSGAEMGSGGDGVGGNGGNSQTTSSVVAPSVPRSGADLTPELARENRDLARDLIEVPQALKIAVAPQAVTFEDDLTRSRTYPIDGAKRKYQLGAAQFDAAVEWDGTQLRKHISGQFGFRMVETYFLSPDGRRLFVIVRVGEPKKGEPVQGFNRVYDRADP